MLRVIYYPWILLPYPVRKVVTAAGIWSFLLLRRLKRTDRRTDATPVKKLFTLSFWGVPRVDAAAYTLTVDGTVGRPLRLSLDELKALPQVERPVTLDCVGGSRNNFVMTGVSFATLIERAQPGPDAQIAVFHCADGYFTSYPVEDLVHAEAFMAYAVNGEEMSVHGYPLRLALPGRYGYKWAKWVVRVELVPGPSLGYWEKRGLPDRARVGDIW